MPNQYEPSSDLSSVESSISNVSNETETSINLSGTNAVTNRKSITSSSYQTVFERSGSGYISVQAIAPSTLAPDGEITIYENFVDDQNRLAFNHLGGNEVKCVGCGQVFYKDGVIVQAKSDGTNTLDLIINTIGFNAGENNTQALSSANALLESNPTANSKNTSTDQVVGHTLALRQRGILTFDLSLIDTTQPILAATLNVYFSLMRETILPLSVHNILQPVDPDTVTWNEYSAGNVWNAGGGQAGTDYDTEPIVSVIGPYDDDTIISFDVTSWTRKVVNDGLTNNGLLLKFDSDTTRQTLSCQYRSAPGGATPPELEYTQ